MSIFVVGINPSGSAGRDGRMHIGDELLEVSILSDYIMGWYGERGAQNPAS